MSRPYSARFSVAPMMDWTDRRCRAFHRVLTRRARLYTEMVTADAVVFGPRERLIGFDAAERPVALQLGGAEPARLAEAARIGAEFGYDEINLNCGCPSDRVQSGRFGACLMREPELVAECVRRCDGVLLTGGDDVNPKLYAKRLPPRLRKTVAAGPGERDLRELLLIDEVFRQRKPVFGICRGHQIINVALGGDLVVDIRSQIPRAINHRQLKKKSEIVHEARLTRDSMLAKITGKQKLGVNSTHHQAVGRVAKPLRVTAVSNDGVVEAMELKREESRLLPYFMTVQFHPERLATRHPEHQELFNSFIRACVLNRNRNL